MAAESLFTWSHVAPARPPAPAGPPGPDSVEKKLYASHRQKTFEYLLGAGAKINLVTMHPSFDWTPLSFALMINFGWEHFLDKGAVIDEVCLELVGDLIKNPHMRSRQLAMLGTVLAERFLLAVSDDNLSEEIRSK